MTPLATWDDGDSEHDNLVWWSRLDKRFQIEVQRIDERNADLVIFDHLNENAVIHTERVGLSYGAIFGPDVDDIGSWQDRAIEIIDAL